MFLVLTRKEGESIMVGHDIEIAVARIQGDKVRIAVKAPKDIPIVRKEVEAKVAT